MSHVTWTPYFQDQKFKGQGHQTALLWTSLTCKAAAAVSVETYLAWESTASLRLLGGARGAWTPIGRGKGREHFVLLVIVCASS